MSSADIALLIPVTPEFRAVFEQTTFVLRFVQEAGSGS